MMGSEQSLKRPSIRSTRSARKYSTDRHLRQAELSVHLEEGESRRPYALLEDSIVEDDNEAATNQNVASQLERGKINTLARADTFPSPHENHPGHRIDYFSLSAVNKHPTPTVTQYDSWAWPGPQKHDTSQTITTVGRQDTGGIDLSRVQTLVQKPAQELRQKSTSLLRWVRTKAFANVKASRSMAEGLAPPVLTTTAFGLAFIGQRAADWDRRKQLRVLEYGIDSAHDIICSSSLNFQTTVELRQHVRAIESKRDLRIIHIRNHEEAFGFLDSAFAISNSDTSSGTERGFREWLQAERNSRQTAHMTIRWRPSFDTNRTVICLAFGIDLGPRQEPISLDSPANHGAKRQYSVQQCRRIACYIQRTPQAALPGPRMTQFDSRRQQFEQFAYHDTLLICDYSPDATSELTNTTSLRLLNPTTGFPFSGSSAVMSSALRQILEEIVKHWESEIAAIHHDFTDLEDAIYARPADMRYQQQVWAWSQRLHYMLKLVLRHLKTLQAFQEDFCFFSELQEPVEWFDDVLDDLKNIGDTISTDYIQPLEHMIDLMYKSVTIRDSRQSLGLNASLWRLSWITFIFLPMTFLVGFFGMNVRLFQTFPPIRWFFAALVPLFIAVFVFWLMFRKYGPNMRRWATGDESL